jgi:hypothetical protein
MHLLRKGFLTSLVLAGWLAGASGARAQSVFGVVEMDSWRSFSSNLAVCSQQAGLPFLLTGLNRQGGALLRAPNLTGMDLQRPIRLYLLLNPAKKGMVPDWPYVAALPLTGSGGAYLGMVSNAYESVVLKGDLWVCARPRGEKVFAQRSLTVLVTNGVALVGAQAAEVTAVAEAMRTRSLPVPERMPTDLRISLDLPRLLPFLEQHMATMREQQEQQRAAMRAMAPDVPEYAGGGGREMELVLNLFRQVREVNIGVGFDATAVTLRTAVLAQTNSVLSSFLRELRPASERYTRILPANTLAGVVGGSMEVFKVLAKPYSDFMATCYAGVPGLAGMSESMRKQMTQSVELYTGDYALGILPDARSNGVVFAQVMAISDPRKVRKVMSESLAMSSAMLSSNALFGCSITSLPARVYGGVEVQSACYRMEDDALPQAMALPAMVWFRTFFSALTVESAVVGQDLIVTLGRAGAINPLIDRVRQGGDATFYRAALAALGNPPPAALTDVSHCDLTRAVPTLLPLWPEFNRDALPPLPPPGDGIGLCATRRGDLWEAMLKVTTSEIKAMSQTMPMLSMGQHAAPAASRPSRRPAPPPAP